MKFDAIYQKDIIGIDTTLCVEGFEEFKRCASMNQKSLKKKLPEKQPIVLDLNASTEEDQNFKDPEKDEPPKEDPNNDDRVEEHTHDKDTTIEDPVQENAIENDVAMEDPEQRHATDHDPDENREDQ
ncbi:hypothetical protein ACFX2I_000359 [Malus domestica]